MLIALSTTVCSVPARPTLLFKRCRELGVDSTMGLTLDTRLPLPVQRELLEVAASQVVSVAEIALPMTSIKGHPLGCPLSEDREERQASSQAMLHAVELAADYGVARVLLHPWPLRLHLAVATMLRSFARGEDLPQSALQQERAARTDAASDRLRSALDPVLQVASALGVQLCFAGPTIWPQQFPSASEVERLREEFGGAPLLAAYFSDWAHARATLFGESPERSAESGDAGLWDQLALSSGGVLLPTFGPSRSRVVEARGDDRKRPLSRPLRLADACGARLRLPLGLGQSDWRSALTDNQPDAVLAFDEQTTLAEVVRSREATAEQV